MADVPPTDDRNSICSECGLAFCGYGQCPASDTETLRQLEATETDRQAWKAKAERYQEALERIANDRWVSRWAESVALRALNDQP